MWNANILKQYVAKESHRRVLEEHMLKYRYAFSEVLNQPGIFFYGVSRPVWDIIKGLSRKKMLDAAKAQIRKTKVSGPYDLYESGVHPISEPALYVVRTVANFPDEKLENRPGHKRHFSEDQMKKMRDGNEGIAEYLGHLYPDRERDKHGKN